MIISYVTTEPFSFLHTQKKVIKLNPGLGSRHVVGEDGIWPYVQNFDKK